MEELVKEPGFLHALSYCMPPDAVPHLIQEMLKFDNCHDFQMEVMMPFVEMIAKTTTSGITMGGLNNYNASRNYTYLTNHRDIVLDATFLNLAFMRNGLPITEVAIGNNLLAYEWIETLVRINKSFVVKRDTGIREALLAAKHLSSYIRYALLEKHESIWIAQREGRAKDSSDKTQDSLVKMLALGGEGSFMERIKELNIMPVCISYEYDPNDYLKAREYLMKRRDPQFKKSQRDDLFSMETGLLQFKGKVHFQLTPRINARIDEIGNFRDNNTSARYISCIIDNAIHRSYEIFSINYIAFDELEHVKRFQTKYTEEERVEFMHYIERQIDRMEMDDMTDEERTFVKHLMLTMYSNPLKNKLRALLGGTE